MWFDTRRGLVKDLLPSGVVTSCSTDFHGYKVAYAILNRHPEFECKKLSRSSYCLFRYVE
jgi:hypothetical protein